MPFHWIESLLAISFTLVWLFIGATLLGDRLGEVRQRRSTPRGESQAPHFSGKRRPRLRRSKLRDSADHVTV